MKRAFALLAALWLGLAPALAQEPQLADPTLEQRARDLSREIQGHLAGLVRFATGQPACSTIVPNVVLSLAERGSAQVP